MRPLNIQWFLCYNFIHVYFIKFSNGKIGLNTILTNQFQPYLFTTFIIPKFLKFCSWFTISPIEGSIVSKWNLSKIWFIFLCFREKLPFFLIWYIFSHFFFVLYHALTRYHIILISSITYFKQNSKKLCVMGESTLWWPFLCNALFL
jgi:hypothetical protein